MKNGLWLKSLQKNLLGILLIHGLKSMSPVLRNKDLWDIQNFRADINQMSSRNFSSYWCAHCLLDKVVVLQKQQQIIESSKRVNYC
jgi:hypothetical protein